MPAIFIGHWSPENAFVVNEFSQTWKNIASSFPEPKAIVVISAHWTNHITDDIKGTSVTINKNPKTIHDFYGFPEKFYTFSYKAPGNETLAKKIIEKITTVTIEKNNTWGFDHGARSVLTQMYPKANIPTIQISIDEELPREKIFAIGKELNQLRKDGILILGSGNIVHNLGAIKRNDSPYQWASEFDEYIKKKIRDKEYQAIIDFEKHPIINLALPTVEHFLPLLYIVGAAEWEDPKFFCEKIFASSLSMCCITYGI